MKFRAHEAFFIRKGWLYKGMKGVQANPSVFIDKKDNPMDVLGMGSNMVKSLRYWMQATQLTYENTTKGKSREQHFTDFADIIWENDPYMEELGTLWLIHYHLVTNKDLATAWYFFYNHFTMAEFQREDFVAALSNYAAMSNETPATSSLEDDFNCIINTYVERKKLNPSKVHPESNIESPLDELGLIDIAETGERTYKKASPKKGTINPYILMAIILDQSHERRELKIQELQNDAGNIGKVFNLDIVALTRELERLAGLGLIDVVRTAGLDVVRIKTKLSAEQCIKQYYSSLSN